jgi:hypothetical protein
MVLLSPALLKKLRRSHVARDSGGLVALMSYEIMDLMGFYDVSRIYPLVICYCLQLKLAHLVSLIYLVDMGIFHSFFACLPEGTYRLTKKSEVREIVLKWWQDMIKLLFFHLVWGLYAVILDYDMWFYSY